AESAHDLVEKVLRTLQMKALERRQRELRSLIAEASRRGDDAMFEQLTGERLQVDRELLRMDREMARPF
ncbi:MAG: hypothetical protein PW735_08430, partial [Acidobacteriaceae bacterium]|nr:hypothetical protein [Acidobacteriaceae bacterium]